MRLALAYLALMLVGSAAWATTPDALLNQLVPAAGGGGAAGAAELGASMGRLMESLMVIFGVYYVLKAILIYARINSGKASAQGDTLGGMMSHFVAGSLAYHSRAFFSMINNTIPMVPDFGRLVYDAELMRALM
jgi:hypothetical protein